MSIHPAGGCIHPVGNNMHAISRGINTSSQGMNIHLYFPASELMLCLSLPTKAYVIFPTPNKGFQETAGHFPGNCGNNRIFPGRQGSIGRYSSSHGATGINGMDELVGIKGSFRH